MDFIVLFFFFSSLFYPYNNIGIFNIRKIYCLYWKF